MSAVVITSPAIKYPLLPAQANHGTYQMSRVLPQGQATVQLNASSQQECLIDLPNRVFNLARSSLDFDLDIPAAAAGGTKRLLTIGQSAIERMSLYTRSGVYLADITNCGIYTRCVTPYVTAHDDLQSSDKTQLSTNEAGAEATGKGFFNCCSRTTIADSTADARSARRIVPTVGGTSDADVAFNENQYFSQGAVASTSYLKCSVPLSEFHHTVLSLDKDLYFNQALVMRVSFAGTDKLGGETASAVNALPETVENLGAVIVRNIRLQLAIESNREIADQVRGMVMSTGLSQIVPYVYPSLVTQGGSTEVSQQQRYNAGHGHSLLNIYTVTANSKTSGVLSSDIANQNASQKVLSYQASVDNNLLSEFRPLTRKLEGYVLQRHLLEDSCICNADVFRHNRVQINSWRAGKCVDWKRTDDVIDGLDLSAERIYNIDKTVSQAVPGTQYRHFIFAIVQRTMSISPSGDVTMA